MLNKKNIIHLKKEIDSAFKTGRTWKTEFFLLKFKKNDLGYARFCFVVSAKVSKLAVDRNKIKRQYSEIARVHDFMKAPVDVVMVVYKASLDIDFDKKKEILETALNKIARYFR